MTSRGRPKKASKKKLKTVRVPQKLANFDLTLFVNQLYEYFYVIQKINDLIESNDASKVSIGREMKQEVKESLGEMVIANVIDNCLSGQVEEVGQEGKKIRGEERKAPVAKGVRQKIEKIREIRSRYPDISTKELNRRLNEVGLGNKRPSELGRFLKRNGL